MIELSGKLGIYVPISKSNRHKEILEYQSDVQSKETEIPVFSQQLITKVVGTTYIATNNNGY